MDRACGAGRASQYFGEAGNVVGYFAIGFRRQPYVVAAAVALLITFLLLQVSGVSLMEETMDERRPGYANTARVKRFCALA